MEPSRPPHGPEGASAAIEKLARAGYAAKGIVYIVIGGLAAAAAFSAGRSATDQEGAFATILRQPFGKVLLGLVAVGLAGYSIWKLVQGILDPERKGSDLEGLIRRGAMVVSGIIHAGLVVAAARMIGGGSGNGDGTEGFTAELLSKPFGPWLVGLVGVAVIGAGLEQLWAGWAERFRRRLRLEELPARSRVWAVRAARIGLISRGVVFMVIGWFFLVAAVRAESDEAQGLGEALRTIERQPYGQWLVGLVALGLVAYGIYQLVEARIRRIG